MPFFEGVALKHAQYGAREHILSHPFPPNRKIWEFAVLVMKKIMFVLFIRQARFTFFPSYPGLGVTIMQLKYNSGVLSCSQTTRFQRRRSLDAALNCSSYLFPDAEWIAHSEQLCHSTQHPSLPPSHPSVTLHGVQRHHLGLCDRTHVAAGQWQCSISPQL